MTTYKAVWCGREIARSDRTVGLEGNRYFPADSVAPEVLQNSNTHTRCPWKGEASYYDVIVDAQTNADAAWYYPDPSPAAEQIRGHVAFWHGVQVLPVAPEGARARRSG